MRIGILLTGFDGGGAQRRLLTLARGFLERGHEVEILVGDDSGPFRANAPAGAEVVSLKNLLHRIPGVTKRKTLRMLAALPALALSLRRARIDVLLGGSTPANLAGLVARSLSRAPLPVAVSVNVPLSRSTTTGGRPAQGRLVRRFYPEADAVIANACALATDAVTLCGLEPGRVFVIPNPVPVDAIAARALEPSDHPWLKNREAFAERCCDKDRSDGHEHGPGNGERNGEGEIPVLLAVGKLKAQKDHATLLRALRRVRDARPVRLVVLGSGEKRDALVAQAAALGLSADVDFAGFCANPFAAMARADLLLSSSRWEGFSNVLAEGLACGCPIVATDCAGGVAELLGDGRFGALVPPGDDAAMAEAVLATLASPPPRGRQIARSREYSVDQATEAYLRVLRDCVDAHRSRKAAAVATPPVPGSPNARSGAMLNAAPSSAPSIAALPAAPRPS